MKTVIKMVAVGLMKVLGKKEVQDVLLKTAENLAKKTENKVDDRLVELITILRAWINEQ